MAFRKLPDKDRREKFLRAIKTGSYIETALAYAGITRSWFYKHIKLGRDAVRGDLKEFVEELDEALAFAEMYHVNQIIDASKNGVWQASCWMLERRWPSRWARKDRIEAELSSKQEKPIKVVVGSDGTITLKDNEMEKIGHDEENLKQIPDRK